MSAKCHFIIKAVPSPSNRLPWLFLHSMAPQSSALGINDIHIIHRRRDSNIFCKSDYISVLH